MLAAKLKTLLQIGQHLIRTFEAGFEIGAKPAEIRRLLRGDLDAGRAQELMDEMRAAGLPT